MGRFAEMPLALKGKAQMTISQNIKAARGFIVTAPYAYAATMSGFIRSANSDRAAQAYRNAIREDGMEIYFAMLDSASPIARR